MQDWRRRVVTRFNVTMLCSWQDDVGTLEEKFDYYDGKTQQRTWMIRKNPDGTYQGTANDILGIARGYQQGSAMHWCYRMDVPVGW